MIRPQFGSVSAPSFGAPRGTVQSVTGHTGCAAGRRFEMHGDLNGAHSKLFSDREDRQAGTKIQMCLMRRANYGTRLAAIAYRCSRSRTRVVQLQPTAICEQGSRPHRKTPGHSVLFCFPDGQQAAPQALLCCSDVAFFDGQCEHKHAGTGPGRQMHAATRRPG